MLPLAALNEFEALIIELFKLEFDFPFDSQFAMEYLACLLQEDWDVVQTI